MEKKEIYIHSGIHKTGSTAIQKDLLKHDYKDVKILIKSSNNTDPNSITDKILYYLKYPEKTLENKIKQMINEISQKKIIISNEGLFGHQGNGFVDVKKRFDLMENLFDDPKYIIFFREPSGVLSSWYNFSIRKDIDVDFMSYCTTDINLLYKIIPKDNRVGTNYKIYNYNEIFKPYLNIITRVLFLEYESFFSKYNDSEYKKLSLFLGVDLKNKVTKKFNSSDKNLIYFNFYKNNLLFKFIKFILGTRISQFILKNIRLSKLEPYSNEGIVKDWMILSKIVSLLNIFYKRKINKNIDDIYKNNLKTIKEYHSANYLNFKELIKK